MYEILEDPQIQQCGDYDKGDKRTGRVIGFLNERKNPIYTCVYYTYRVCKTGFGFFILFIVIAKCVSLGFYISVILICHKSSLL